MTDLDPARAEEDWARSSTRNTYIAVGTAIVAMAGVLWFVLGVEAPPPPQPVGTPRPPTARFTGIEGTVTKKALGTFNWKASAVPDHLNQNDLVRTAARSSAEITFIDETLVNVSADSLITIENVSEDPTTHQRRVAWTVSSGEVAFERRADGGEAIITTPTLRTKVRDKASASIRVDEAGESDLRIFSGRGTVTTRTGQQVELQANEGLKVNAEGVAGEKLKLPSAPALAAPPVRATTKLRPTLRWRAVPEAVEYRVVVARDPRFNQPVWVKAGVRGTRIETARLETGTHYWRVAATGEGGGEGPYSTGRSFDVARGAGPGLIIDSLEARGNVVQIKGRTQPGVELTVNGQPLQLEADGSFEEFITLLQPGTQVLVLLATDQDGISSEVKRSVSVQEGGS